VLVLAVAALLVAGAAGAVVTRTFSTPGGSETRVLIPEGATFRAATDSLVRAGVVSRPRLFRAYGRLTGTDRRLKPGTYLFRQRTPWRDVVAALAGGHGLVRSVTIPEGFSLAQIAAALSRALDVPAESVLTAASDTTLLRALGAPTPTLEGYLFPDTYAFPEGTTASRAVSEMVRRFQREWEPGWEDRLTSLSLSRHELVTLASIVEREARVAEERPVIAAVFLNRLRIGMPLQADPTVQYARGSHTPRVTYQDLRVDSPYNTYLYPGLPPGPIASPGGASLRASLNPADVPYLYFVAFPDGRHEFRRTLAEHVQAVRAARAAWDSTLRAAQGEPSPPVPASVGAGDAPATAGTRPAAPARR
jgi:UPF0755 protein